MDSIKRQNLAAVDVAQLAEQLLLIQEVGNLNPVIGQYFIMHMYSC